MRPLLVACVVLAALAGACDKPRRDARGSLGLQPCTLSAPGTGQVIGARCGALDVWEDREARTGRKIALRIAVVPASGKEVAPDPLFVVVGGPGQAAIKTYPALAGAFARIRERRDIVLVDQRGTGESHRLDCPEPPDDAPDDVETVARLASECLAGLDADVRHYGTRSAVDDLDDVRAALGYETIDVYGGSYGTRVGLVYARRHRAHLRALVLDGVAPPPFVVGATTPRDAQRSFDAIAGACARAPDCHRAFPDLARELGEVLDRLAAPVTLAVPDPVSGAPVTVLLTRKKAASTILALAYARETIALVPLLVHDAWSTRDYRRLAAQSLVARDLVSLAMGMHLAVTCSEDAPFLKPEDVAAAARGTYLGDALAEGYIRACARWPRAPITDADRAPVVSDVPTLLLSGEIDPVTPPDGAAAAAATLARSRHVVVRGEGHGNIVRGCVPRLVAEFVERGSVERLDASCADRGHDVRFFTSLAGPAP